MKVLVKYGAQVDLPVRCDVQKWIQGWGVLFGQTDQLALIINIKICSDSLACGVCIYYDMEHYVHGTRCAFLKLMQDKNGDTALIKACEGGHVETVRVLLDHEAIVDQQNKV